jgi:hypothetical protein
LDALLKRAKHLGCIVLLLTVLIALSGCAHQSPSDNIPNGSNTTTNCSDHPELCTKVLFIGNSYTYVNDLPTVFTNLADSGGHPVETGLLAQGGWTLAQHANDSNTQTELAAKQWNYVVLQEQSEIPSVEQSRIWYMYPAARTLVKMIRDNGEEPMFFMTWGHRDGLTNWSKDYESMQQQLTAGYLTIADELGVPVAPVGSAWEQVRQQDPGIDLWQSDGSHPTENGTYLAACVFYAAIFNESPQGLSYTAQIPADTARTLQSIAASVVLNDSAEWNLR